MGDINQFNLVKKLSSQLKGPFLEIGSKDYGNTQNLRPILSEGEEYIGIDMAEGPGVDTVLDMTTPFENVDQALSHARFETIICLSVLEHCDQPFKMAENITKLLKPGGKLVVCVPFVWKFHGYPSDYWRFTHEGVKKLFPDLEFEMESSTSATSRLDEYKPLDDNIGKVMLSSRDHYQEGHYLRGMIAKVLRFMGKFKMLSWLTGYRYVMVPTSIFMVGKIPVKKENVSHNRELESVSS